MYSFTIG